MGEGIGAGVDLPEALHTRIGDDCGAFRLGVGERSEQVREGSGRQGTVGPFCQASSSCSSFGSSSGNGLPSSDGISARNRIQPTRASNQTPAVSSV